MRREVVCCVVAGCAGAPAVPATPASPAAAVVHPPPPPLLVTAPRTKQLEPFVAVDAPVVAIAHVRVIDGTGAAARDDQTIVIRDGRIAAIGDAKAVDVPAGARVIDGTGKTAFPGLVDMHGHLYYGQLTQFPVENIYFAEQPISFPRLYLAGGVTTARTTGSLEPYADLAVKRRIDSGDMPGPHLALTAPYISGTGEPLMQMVQLATPAQARAFVDFWADAGFTSFKAYMHLSRAVLGAAIDEAHARGLKVTGHLCSVGYREAAELGIDNLEHGLVPDTELVDGKRADECPDGPAGDRALVPGSAGVRATIDELVKRHVAVTSTLAIFEQFARADKTELDPRALAVLNPTTRDNVVKMHAMLAQHPSPVLEHELAIEHAFVKAGGFLMAGSDPTGYGAVVAGFGDQRQVELLVEAGFTAAEAIQIASANGAKFLGIDGEVGTLAQGKRADIVVVTGNPELRIADIEHVELVFKDGVGYDPAKLVDSVKGTVGLH